MEGCGGPGGGALYAESVYPQPDVVCAAVVVGTEAGADDVPQAAGEEPERPGGGTGDCGY